MWIKLNDEGCCSLNIKAIRQIRKYGSYTIRVSGTHSSNYDDYAYGTTENRDVEYERILSIIKQKWGGLKMDVLKNYFTKHTA